MNNIINQIYLDMGCKIIVKKLNNHFSTYIIYVTDEFDKNIEAKIVNDENVIKVIIDRFTLKYKNMNNYLPN